MVKTNATSVGFPGSEPWVVTFTIPGFDSWRYAGYLHLGARYSKIVPKSSAPQIAHAGWLVYTLIHRSSSQINIFFSIEVFNLSMPAIRRVSKYERKWLYHYEQLKKYKENMGIAMSLQRRGHLAFGLALNARHIGR